MPLRTDYSAMNCSLARALQQVGDPWTLLLLRECFMGADRFEGFAQALGVSRQVLSQRLAGLVDHGLLQREGLSDATGQALACQSTTTASKPASGTPADPVAQAVPKRARYRLTDKGRDLAPALLALMQWGDRWVSGAGQEPVLATTASGEPLAPVGLRSSTGHMVSPSQLRWQPGPGSDPRTRAHLRQLATPDR